MARLIKKDDVIDYAGQLVWLETKYRVEIAMFVTDCCAFTEKEDGDDELYCIDFALLGVDAECHFMENYGKSWRLWDAYIEQPSVKEMSAAWQD